jgi:dipeptidyl aminopeptidase/acylaminoacyl peptidase
LEGILTLPAHYETGKKYPYLVLPHGGPEGNDTLDFDPFTRLIAGFGYLVLQPQYRGSTGYGSGFMNAIYQHLATALMKMSTVPPISPSLRAGPIPIASRSLDGAPAAL